MESYNVTKPKSDHLAAWAMHEVTKNLRKQAEEAEAWALEFLLNTCNNSPDARVVRALTEYRAALELKALLAVPKGTDDDEA